MFALKRYQGLEQKFLRNPDLHKQYSKVIQDYLDSGYLEPTDSAKAVGECFYLPLRAVRKDSSATTKTRDDLMLVLKVVMALV